MPYMNRDNADRLVNKYADMILRIAYMYLKQTQDAEDICQDVFLKLAAREFHFDECSAEKAWIIRATINACKDHLRTSFWKRVTASGGNTVLVSGKDDAENTLEKWNDLYAEYTDADGAGVSLSLSAYTADEADDRTPTETRTIDGITVSYNYDEYLVLPNENEPLSPEVQAREETDDHFFVSYGSSEEETIFYSGVSFVKDGISYNLFTRNNISSDELFDMAKELIGK